MRTLAIAAVAASALLGGIATAAAADMAVKARPAPIVAAAYDWSGFYVGGNVGGAWIPGSGGSDFGPLFPPFAILPPITPIFTVIPGQLDRLTGSGSRSGVIGGGQIGYNWQVKQFVFGVEADAIATDLKGSSLSASRTFGPPLIPVSVTQTVNVDTGRTNWMASFRGRIGFAADRVLFYATGGAAVADFSGTRTTVINGPGIGLPAGTFTTTNGGSTTRWGWTVGGGVEWAFANQWSLAGEYRHTDFGNAGATVAIPDGLGGTFATVTTNSNRTFDQATLRVNYRFGGPVVARY